MNKPNIVFILVDDMGYGDVHALNPQGKIPTPCIDQFANQGMIFTDAHSSSAVCTPSRYSLLTGRYNWRSTLQKGIVRQYGDALISENRITLPGYLRTYGYHTACIGKWHLGMGWDFEPSTDFLPDDDRFNSEPLPRDLPATDTQKQLWRDAFSKPTKAGPTTRGFDYYFGVDVPNWPPYCFIENDRTVGIPSEFLPSRLFGSNQASTPGPALPYWHFEQLLPTWAQKADAYIGEQAASNTPFFLYLPLTSPHTPISVNAPWIGKSGLNHLYADFVMETDDIIGQVLHSLEAHQVADNTLVLFASDNGCASYIGVEQMEQQGHFPSAHLRGYKADAWDGGHRIPFIARWNGVIQPGTRTDHLVCLTDVFRTCADFLDDSLSDAVAEDSFSIMPLFRGEEQPIRNRVIHHSIYGKFAIRDGRWKLVLCPGSGGWTLDDAEAAKQGLPLVQLYDMQEDPSETTNLALQNRAIVQRMVAQLKEDVDRGRSTPGEPRTNDTEVDIWKLDSMPGVDARLLDDY
jgi:arylsulfatase A